MNQKMFKTKPLAALVLALLMVVPMLFVAIPTATVKAQVTAPTIYAVLDNSGVATTNSLIPATAVGNSFTVDIYINNTQNVSPGINAVSLMVTWTPAVLTCTNMVDGSYLNSDGKMQALGDLGPNTGSATFGQIIINTKNPNDYTTNTAGIIGQLTFQVVGTGSTFISIVPSAAGIAYLDYPVSGKSTPVVGTEVFAAQYNPVTAISLYQTGTSNNAITLTGDPINQTFGVDIYINNPLAVNVWAWNLGLTWNPAALQLTNIVEGTYLNQTGNTFFVPGYVNNNVGDIPQGISDVYLSYKTQNAAAGVLATVYFQVINYADSNINLVQGIPSLLTLNSTTNQPLTVTPAPVLNGATYTTSAPPAPTQPVAVITQDSVPTGGVYYANAPIEFDGLQSTGGVDVTPNPNSPNYPITSYAWTITPAITGAPLSGNTTSFIAPTVQTETTYTLTLTVTTTPDTADPNYVNTATASTTFIVQAPLISPSNAGTVVDVFITQLPTNSSVLAKGAWGYGPNAYCDAFGPQEWMNLTAYVTYNGGSVADKEVDFVVKDSYGDVIATLPATTDSLGYASYLYQLRWYTTNGGTNSTNVGDFGIWTVSAQTTVGAEVVYDTMPFDYNYIVTVTSVTAIATVARTPIASGASAFVPTVQNITVSLANVDVLPENVYVTYTILDNQSVPIATGCAEVTVKNASYVSGAPTSDSLVVTPGNGSVSFYPTIPNYAFVGTATVIVQVFTENPTTTTNYAATFGQPAQTTSFTIVQETGSQPQPSGGSSAP